jgi:hypothetical protein
VRIEISSSDYPDLQSLHEWLSHDPSVARQSKVDLRSSGRAPGEQSALDVIDVVLSNATALAALAVSYATWRQARRPTSSTTFEARPNQVTIEGEEADPAGRIIEALPVEDGPDVPEPPEQE